MIGHVAQAVILCGGLGTRLGSLTAKSPKPLLPVGGRPFLSLLIDEIARQGIERFLLLAAFESEQIRRFAVELPLELRRQIKIDVSVEPKQAGTGGALRHAYDSLDPVFFMFNGDSWFDIPLVELRKAISLAPDQLGVIALREMASSARYGTIEIDQQCKIISFDASGRSCDRSLVNAGVYLFRRAVVETIPSVASLERDQLPRLASAGALSGVIGSSYFIDIGVPADYERAQYEITTHRRRPALFLDRDGVINVDRCHVGTIGRFEWIEGAQEAIRCANKLGYYVFVVTNQAGIGKGLYTIEDYRTLTRHIRRELSNFGGHIDDERFCPYHPGALLPQYRCESNWRKPAPGMILDLFERWPIEKHKSFLVGDKQTDVEAAQAAGIAGHLFRGGPLDKFISPLLAIHK